MKDLHPEDKLVQDSINEAVEATAKKSGIDPQEWVEKLRTDVEAKDPRAISELNDLISLIVITHQEKTILMSGMSDIVNSFITEPDASTRGNGKRFIKHFIKKAEDFNEADYIPTGTKKAAFKVNFIKFKNDDGSVATTSMRKRWDVVYIEAEMIGYFVNGQLSEFISKYIVSQIGDSVIVFMYDYIMKAITTEDGLVETGRASNLFEALTTELFPLLEEMRTNTAKFNKDKSLTEAIDASRKEDLMLLCSPKVKTMLKSNIMSQLFNSQKVSLTNYVGSVHSVNHKFDMTGDTVKTTNDYYVGDDTIIVIDKRNYFKALKMLEVQGSQYYVRNTAREIVLHLWFATGYLGWGKKLIYKNANLTTSPSA